MSMILFIKNDGKEIVETNYFSMPQSKAGKFFVSLNAGAFRLLVPDQHTAVLKRELALAASVRIVHRGEVASIILDDGTPDPYTIETTMNAFDRRPAAMDSGKQFTFTAWVDAGDSKVAKVAELPCMYMK